MDLSMYGVELLDNIPLIGTFHLERSWFHVKVNLHNICLVGTITAPVDNMSMVRAKMTIKTGLTTKPNPTVGTGVGG